MPAAIKAENAGSTTSSQCLAQPPRTIWAIDRAASHRAAPVKSTASVIETALAQAAVP